jgi:hypothetical protein
MPNQISPAQMRTMISATIGTVLEYFDLLI